MSAPHGRASEQVRQAMHDAGVRVATRFDSAGVPIDGKVLPKVAEWIVSDVQVRELLVCLGMDPEALHPSATRFTPWLDAIEAEVFTRPLSEAAGLTPETARLVQLHGGYRLSRLIAADDLPELARNYAAAHAQLCRAGEPDETLELLSNYISMSLEPEGRPN